MHERLQRASELKVHTSARLGEEFYLSTSCSLAHSLPPTLAVVGWCTFRGRHVARFNDNGQRLYAGTHAGAVELQHDSCSTFI